MPSKLSLPEVKNLVQKANKTANSREIPFKGLHFGQLFFDAGDYSSAAEWVKKYLQSYDRDAKAHKLLGQCYEKLSELEAALSHFKQSLQIKQNQPDLLLHIVELYLNPGPVQNPNKAQVWLNKAASALPGNPKVFKLKMELLVAQEATPAILDKAIKEELKHRDWDFSLHREYVSFLKTQGRLIDAYKYCSDLENAKQAALTEDYDWCLTVVTAYKDYFKHLESASQYSQDLKILQSLYMEALMRFVHVCVKQKKIDQALKMLLRVDEVLQNAVSHSLSGDWQIVEEEMKGQLMWMSANIVLLLADLKKLSRKDANTIALVLYSASLSKPLPNMTSSWAAHATRGLPNLPSRLLRNAGMRRSQCCHMIRALCQNAEPSTLLQDINLEMVGARVIELLCSNTAKVHNSYIASNRWLPHTKFSIPSYGDMLQYDEISVMSGNLHDIVWIGLRWCRLDHANEFLPWVKKIFPNMRFSPSTDSSSALVLDPRLLDMEAFLAACTFTTNKLVTSLEVNSREDRAFIDSPPMLTKRLTNDRQEKLWQAALKLTAHQSRASKSMGELAKLKPVLQRGLEVLRGVANHGMEAMLLCELAKYFESNAFNLQQEAGITAAWFDYQRRAALYWSLALPDLQRAVQGRVLHRPQTVEMLFPLVYTSPTPEEAVSLLSDAHMCHGELAAQENRTEDAVSFYSKATMPQASFCLAQIYKKLSENAVSASVSQNPMMDGEKQKEIYFKKYKHCLEVTLTRLQQHPDDKLHERTVGLLASIQITPPRFANDRSRSDTVIPGPSKQSTPKMDDSITNSVLSTLVEKDSVTNLVDSLASLTSAVSGLKLEMGQLREESKMRQYATASPSFVSQGHATPQRVIQSSSQFPMHPPMTPQMFGTGVDGLPPRPAPAMTPQRILAQSQNLLASIQAGRVGTPTEMMASYLDPAYHIHQPPAQQVFYSPQVAPSYYPNSPYQPYSAEMINGVTAPPTGGFQGATAAPQQVARVQTPVGHGKAVPNYNSNTLVAALQGKGGADALQQRLAGLASSPAPHVVAPKTSLAASNNKEGVAFLHKGDTTQPVQDQPQEPPKTSLIQKLLQTDNHANVETPKKQSFTFLDKFVAPKSPGAEMTFQSPEQMDRENRELDALENDDNDTSNNNDTGPHFEPIVSLPEVEVQTGEEGEDALFREKCRLFRYDDTTWKERGIGEMKVLRHKNTGKIRLVMRREQVHKVCCNHMVSAGMFLDYMKTSERAVVWHAQDFSEGEAREEQLAARFKSRDIAEKFRDLVNGEAAKLDAAVKAPPSAPKTPTLKSLLTAKSFEKPTDQAPTNTGLSSIANAASAFKFTMPKPEELKPEAKKAEEPKPAVFGALADALSKGYGGSGPEGGIKPGAFKFSFGPPKPKEPEPAPVQKPPERAEATGQVGDDGDDVDTSDGPHFEPQIELPDLVDLQSGEEDEKVLFCERSKLFRFVESIWKERGLGEIKILKHKTTSKHRVVMRREQVLKLCANHYITVGMRIQVFDKTGKSLTWIASDFSETESVPTQEVFVAKFANQEIAERFKACFEAAASSAPSKEPETTPPSGDTLVHANNNSAAQPFAKPSVGTATAAAGFTVKVPAGTWECSDCYASNPPEVGRCKCCSAANPAAPKQEAAEEPPQLWKFGTGAPKAPTAPVFGVQPDQSASLSTTSFTSTATTFGSLAPPPTGTWDCDACYAPNPPDVALCKCCNTAKLGTAMQDSKTAEQPAKEPSAAKPSNLGVGQSMFSNIFGGKGAQTNAFSPAKPFVSATSGGGSGLSFGTVSSSNKPGSAFSFGVKQEAKNQVTDSNASTPAHSSPAVSNKQGLGSFAPPTGTWECEACYAPNPSDVAMCKCCKTAKPGASKQEQTDASATPSFGQNPPASNLFGLKSGQPAPSLFSSSTFGSATSSGSQVRFGASTFSFGAQPAAENAAAASKKEHPVLQRAGAIQKPAVVNFAFQANSESSSTKDGQSVFSTFKLDPEVKLVGAEGHRIAKPRFPDLGNDDEEEEDSGTSSSDEYTTEDDSTSGDERDEYADEGQGQGQDPALNISPMRRFEAKAPCTPPEQDGDVVCLGEVLPSKELQEKAEQLRLPPHFYNYLEHGKSKGGVSSDTDEESADRGKATAVATTKDRPAPTRPLFGSTGGTTFADLAASGSSFKFGGQTKADMAAWKPASKPIFSGQTENNNESAELYKSEDRDDIHFDPVVKLPEKVELFTGEEDEDTLYSQRAKLFRWDGSQWKERGVGEICIKYNPNTGKYRILMRREQVHKVCANHYLTAELKLTPMPLSDRAWMWIANDFSEDSATVEKFAVRFKNSEIAETFREKVQECQMLNAVNSSASSKSEESATKLITQVEKMKSELGFFKDKLLEKPKIDLDNTITEGLVPGKMENFDPSKVSLTPLVQRHIKQKSQVKESASTDKDNDDVKPSIAKGNEVSSIGLSKFQFKMTTSPEAPRKSREISVCSATSDDSNVDIHFEPQIALPDKIEVVTGEENERVLFESRSKLFSFDRDGGEWKERGLGEVKLLQDTQSFRIRLVMRREQVLKVCLNHRVNADVTFTFKDNSDDKVLLWTANDFSNTEKPDGEYLQFAIKFKTAEIAARFLEAVDESKQAADEGKLLDSFEVSQEPSYTTAPEDEDSVASGSAAGGDSSVHEQRSPLKLFNKLPNFSFANVESPLKKDYSKGFKFSEFAADASKPSTGTTASQKFTFNASSFSFNFGSTSTPAPPPAPMTSAPMPGQQAKPASHKPPVIKSLFGQSEPATSSRLGTSLLAKAPEPPPKADNAPVPAAATHVSRTENDDVIFVWQATPSAEQRRRAEELLLPPTYFIREDDDDQGFDSDAEDRILEYIRRRDDPERVTPVGDATAESRDASEPDVADEQNEREEVKQPPAADEKQPRESAGPVFGSLSTAGTFSFAAMASSGGQNQAFGSRKDAAFAVSDAAKVMFSGQEERDQDPEAYDPEYRPVLAEPPPEIEVKTGEEEEEVLFKERCKLFRFDSDLNQWKERGLGEMKILRHPERGIYRVVMRREQVLKLCANHLISRGMNLIANGEKAWLYVANDRAGGEPTVEKLSVRFKTVEIANKFKQVWEDCVERQQ